MVSGGYTEELNIPDISGIDFRTLLYFPKSKNLGGRGGFAKKSNSQIPIIEYKVKMKQDIREFINSYKYEINNYYLSENDTIDLIQKYLLRYLEGLLSHCLNVSEGRCNIWYLDSHRECAMLMEEIDKIKAGI